MPGCRQCGGCAPTSPGALWCRCSTAAAVASVYNAATVTLTNKRITKRVSSTSGPGGTPSMDTDNYDLFQFTALAAAITSMTTNLTGTPVAGDLLMIQFLDNGTARAITWGTSFAASTVLAAETARNLPGFDRISAARKALATAKIPALLDLVALHPLGHQTDDGLIAGAELA